MKKRRDRFFYQLWFGVSAILATTYLGVCVFLRLAQNRLIFFPSPTLANTPAILKLSYEEIWIPVGGEKIHGWWIPAATAKALTVLFLHGNASNNGDGIYRAFRFHQLGLSVLLVDYRGYGRSEGYFPNETRVYEDAQSAWNYLTQTRQIPPEQIILYGHSLGGAIAIDLAVRYPDISGIIVESSFTSMRDMVNFIGADRIFPTDWLLTHQFDSLTKVRSLQMPILVIHGSSDRVIPVEMSYKLFAAAPDPKKLSIVPNAGHDNIAQIGEQRYLTTLDRFIQSLSDRSSHSTF